MMPAAIKHLLAAALALATATANARLMADPLPIGTSEALFLYRGQTVQAERINWRTGQSKRFDFPFVPIVHERDYLQEYSLALTPQGLWMVGPAVVLLEPDGRTRQLDFGGNRPLVVALDDGSVLAFGKGKDHYIKDVYRISRPAGGKGIELRTITKPANLSHNANAVKLADGRVLILDGYWQGGRTWLYDPRRDALQDAGPTAGLSARTAMAALPDGRAVAIGAAPPGPIGATPHGAAVWNPVDGRWQALPGLPLSARIEAYRAIQPSVAVLPDGSLVVAGAMHRQVLLLRSRGKGFADHWTVAGTLSRQHVGGIVQALGNQEVVVLGGVHPHDNGQCCRDQEEKDRLTWQGDGVARRTSVSVDRREAALAHRGSLTFAAGGWESFFLSTNTIQASAVAELIDHRTGAVQELPPLPAPLLTGRAQWLDDDRILVKAVSHDNTYEAGFRHMDGRGLEQVSSGFLAVFSRRANAWRRLDDPRIAKAELAGILKGQATLVGPDARAWTVDVDRLDADGIRELPQLARRRQDAALRLLADGRIVAAGGKVQSDLISIADPACAHADCPDTYQGFGSLVPARRHEVFDPAAGRWRHSALSRGAGLSAVVRADGRVVKLGVVARANSDADAPDGSAIEWSLEESATDGTRWHELALPQELGRHDPSVTPPCGSGAEESNCVLLLAQAPISGQELIFLRLRRWDSGIRDFRHDLWLYDDGTELWLPLARGQTESQLAGPMSLPVVVAGKPLQGAIFRSESIRLWLE